jgi:hypothetical protein
VLGRRHGDERHRRLDSRRKRKGELQSGTRTEPQQQSMDEHADSNYPVSYQMKVQPTLPSREIAQAEDQKYGHAAAGAEAGSLQTSVHGRPRQGQTTFLL